MDVFGDPDARDAVSPFVRLLWERGAAYEAEVIGRLSEEFVDLSALAGEAKEVATRKAMDAGTPLIYSGRISSGDLLGEPDLLRREGSGYVAGDIKSGAGEEGGSEEGEGKPKKHYAVQLALYTQILEELGLSARRVAFVWDIHGDEIAYDFMAPIGAKAVRTLWSEYEEALATARAIVERRLETRPAYSSGDCKLCVWYGTCLKRLYADDDLTLIPELGRSKRDVMVERVGSIAAFAAADVEGFISGKKTSFPGIGSDVLRRLQSRARLITAKGEPYLRDTVSLPDEDLEVFFDVEVDPMRGLCYLHGFVDRRGGRADTERYLAFFAEEPTPEAERRAFAAAWEYLSSVQPCALYFYSKYERTTYRTLRSKYPDVCSEEAVEAVFAPPLAVDLYFDVVRRATEWPTKDFSIKSVATQLGFSWRDTDPSGAASIEWFDSWLKKRDPEMKERILAYNEDDCRATLVLLDAIRLMERR
jgi:predicted RecB family nuclease